MGNNFFFCLDVDGIQDLFFHPVCRSWCSQRDQSFSKYFIKKYHNVRRTQDHRVIMQDNMFFSLVVLSDSQLWKQLWTSPFYWKRETKKRKAAVSWSVNSAKWCLRFHQKSPRVFIIDRKSFTMHQLHGASTGSREGNGQEKEREREENNNRPRGTIHPSLAINSCMDTLQWLSTKQAADMALILFGHC